MIEPINTNGHSPQSARSELFSLLLRLHPVEAGHVLPGSGNQVQAAFLDMVRQGEPALAEWLHTPNQRRPYTLSLLQGFNHLTPEQLAEAINRNQSIAVAPGQVYWLRITMLDATVFSSFVRYLLTQARALTVRIGEARFEISRMISVPETYHGATSWVAYSSFEELYGLRSAQSRYHFEFATPTAFSLGQKPWGKLLKLFPEPADVFESLARQWNSFAPANLHLHNDGFSPRDIANWCAEMVMVTEFHLQTCHLSSSKFGQTGFLGDVTYEVKGNPIAPQALWLSTLARFALFSGIGYKTTMGMGQARCTSLMKEAQREEVGTAKGGES